MGHSPGVKGPRGDNILNVKAEHANTEDTSLNGPLTTYLSTISCDVKACKLNPPINRVYEGICLLLGLSFCYKDLYSGRYNLIPLV